MTDITALAKRVDALERECASWRDLVSSFARRIDALEHPSLEEPLRQFQRLRKALNDAG